MVFIMNKFSCLVLLFLVFGCSFGGQGGKIILANEVVMTEGMQISATNKIGTITIRAGSGFERFYTWEGETRSQVLEPRKKRWAGRFGIGYSKDNMWANHNTITNANLEETQLHFDDIEDAMSFLNHPGRMDGFTVYNDSGIVVTWKKVINPSKKSGNVLIVELLQVYVAGEKPTNLPGSQNDKILIRER